ncbi:hypothetical protein KCP75_24740 [Salmonella enterica subsp. enterica]|nr:hypothetical protein KCP75_24740 [Salmonella enterica subsp. enterica]
MDYEHHPCNTNNGKIIAIVNQKDRLPLPSTNPCRSSLWYTLRGEIGEDESSHGCRHPNLEGREFRLIPGGEIFTEKPASEATEGKIYGMGHQQPTSILARMRA